MNNKQSSWKLFCLATFLCRSALSSAALDPPLPQGGQGFDMDVGQVEETFRQAHLAKLAVGYMHIDQTLWIALGNQELALVTQECSKEQCITPEASYDASESGVDPREYTGQPMILYQDRQDNTKVDAATVSGKLIDDTFTFVFGGEKNQFDADFLGISSVQIDAESAGALNAFGDPNGYVGLAPYHIDPTDEAESHKANFLWQLKYRKNQSGKVIKRIDHIMFSLSLDLSAERGKDAKTHIQFGGYDTGHLKGGESMHYLRTVNAREWSLKLAAASLGGRAINLGDQEAGSEDSTVELHPNLPFIWVGESDFKSVRQIVNELYGEEVCADSACSWPHSCRAVAQKDLGLLITLTDSTGAELKLDLSSKEMRIPGDQVQSGDANKCFLPIFRSTYKGAKQFTWHLGANFIQKYYMVFDATPVDEHQKDFLRIGFGLADHGADAGGGDGPIKPVPPVPDIPQDDPTKHSFDDYLIYMYIGVGVLALVFAIVCAFKCIRRNKEKRIDGMGDETLGNEAMRLMGKYKDHMEKDKDRSRDKARKRWQKRNPGKSLDEFNMSDLSESYLDTSTTSIDESNTSIGHSLGVRHGINGMN